MNQTLSGNDALLSYAIGYFLPLLVALLTKWNTPSVVKSITLLLLSGISGFLTQWLNADQNHTAFHWQAALVTTLFTFAIGAAGHTSLWSNTKIRKILQDFGVSKDNTPVVTSVPPTNATPAVTGGEPV